MLLSICNFLQPGQFAEGQPTLDESAFGSYAFGPGVGNSWRTDTDVGAPHHVSFADVLRNMDADAAAPQAAGPGHWNDPDYLGPDQGLSRAQFRSQLSMWAMLAAPLMISDDLTSISGASRAAVANGEVIAIDQDPAGVQGTLLASAGAGEVWAGSTCSATCGGTWGTRSGARSPPRCRRSRPCCCASPSRASAARRALASEV
jgi:alpha-galactosidase